LNEIYTGWRWRIVVDKIEHKPLDLSEAVAHGPGENTQAGEVWPTAARR